MKKVVTLLLLLLFLWLHFEKRGIQCFLELYHPFFKSFFLGSSPLAMNVLMLNLWGGPKVLLYCKGLD